MPADTARRTHEHTRTHTNTHMSCHRCCHCTHVYWPFRQKKTISRAHWCDNDDDANKWICFESEALAHHTRTPHTRHSPSHTTPTPLTRHSPSHTQTTQTSCRLRIRRRSARCPGPMLVTQVIDVLINITAGASFITAYSNCTANSVSNSIRHSYSQIHIRTCIHTCIHT